MSDYNKAIDNSKIENINANRKKLGVLYFKMNKYIEAKEIFKQIGNDSTVNPYYMKILNSYFERNDYNNTIKTCEEILGDRDPWNQKLSDPSKKPSILIIRALAYARLGKVDLEDVNLAIKLNPNYVEAYVFRGKLHLLGSKGYADKQGKIHKDDVDISSAISDFTEAIKLNPQFTEAYIARAKAKIEEAYNKTSSNSFNDIDGAMLDFDKALEISPNNVNAFIGRADLKIRLKDYKNAIIDCDNAIKLDQDSGEAYCIRGLAQVKLYRKKLGCEDFLKSLELGYNGAQEYINAYCK
jgi:tetratricopeptide (TPR) repeat protein